MKIETFLNLPTAEVAQLVRDAGPKVCVFPINGTRRWFILEHPEKASTDFVQAYLQISGQRHIELYKLFFDHGIDTLLTPVFGPDILERGEEYDQITKLGLVWFAHNQEFLDFYEAYDVRVHVYGDAHRYLQNTPYADALDAFDKITQSTSLHRRHRLFFGVCAHDPTETIAEIAVRFYQEHGCLPNKHQMVQAYYGEYVEPVDFFIGFERPAVFDMPLIAIGNEDLYFTVSPSPYLDAGTLRAILYDHLYARQIDKVDYATILPEHWRSLAQFYDQNRHHVLGLGQKHKSGVFWYPLPQVKLDKEIF